MSLRQEVNDYLKKEGLPKFTGKLADRDLRNFALSLAPSVLRDAENNPFYIMNTPEHYDSFQRYPAIYSVRLSYLEEVFHLLNGLPEPSMIYDIGCATGIDLCFLAQKFPAFYFFGYDKKEMIKQANERKERNKLENLEFYVSDHYQPQESELQKADVLLAKFFTFESIILFLEGAKKRLKKGALFVIVGGGDKLEENKESFTYFKKIGPIYYNTKLGDKRFVYETRF
jgi:SAM-dependent methyltransferase